MTAVFSNLLTLKDPSDNSAAADLQRNITEAGVFMQQQPGFICFRLVRSTKYAERFMLYAEWENADVLKTAIALPEVRAVAARVRELTAGEPLVYETVSHLGPSKA